MKIKNVLAILFVGTIVVGNAYAGVTRRGPGYSSNLPSCAGSVDYLYNNSLQSGWPSIQNSSEQTNCGTLGYVYFVKENVTLGYCNIVKPISGVETVSVVYETSTCSHTVYEPYYCTDYDKKNSCTGGGLASAVNGVIAETKNTYDCYYGCQKKETGIYLCDTGTFGTPSSTAAGQCEACPEGGTTLGPGQTAKTGCVLTGEFTDEKGTGRYTMPCPWKN